MHVIAVVLKFNNMAILVDLLIKNTHKIADKIQTIGKLIGICKLLSCHASKKLW